MQQFYQVCLVVKNLEAAMGELTRVLGVRWAGPWERDNGMWKFRLAMSLEGPPHFELVEGPPGSPWDATGGSRIDHLQWWTDDLAADTRRLEREGVRLEWDGTKYRGVGGWGYFIAPESGVKIELLEGSPEAKDGIPDYRVRWGIAEA